MFDRVFEFQGRQHARGEGGGQEQEHEAVRTDLYDDVTMSVKPSYASKAKHSIRHNSVQHRLNTGMGRIINEPQEVESYPIKVSS